MPPIRLLHRNTLAAACLAVSACAAAQQAPAADAQALKKGELIYMRCVACHDLAPARSTKIGPTLHGVYGRVMGSVPDFAYSDSLRELRQQSLRWDDTQLDRWLEKPVSVAPGTTMSFIGLPKAADRAALIAYLKAAR